ncbi:MAG: bifunctional adenosylcobinamide kinase/adenosylcobinamide-phosphate guanylyltransferase [Anaerolineaceae bacterium]|nr:bifunctional adenosylcobinamide kinase/adenosylcobinamide-phosphate guanylyltransferase [Anaerolineaceae bacterium]
MEKELTLILGGARSGKSAYAQNLIEESGCKALFVATATAGDDEMAKRIAAHQASRSQNWLTLEVPLNVGEAIRRAERRPWVMVDCMTLLANNVLSAQPQPLSDTAYQSAMEAEVESLIAAYRACGGRWLVVSNEVGLGLVPPSALSRYYRDALGRANQRLAQAADKVFLMVAGIPLPVKG